jgi:hypothetical protein
MLRKGGIRPGQIETDLNAVLGRKVEQALSLVVLSVFPMSREPA